MTRTLTIQLTPEEIYELAMALRARADHLEDRGDPNGARFVDALKHRIGKTLRDNEREVAA